MPFKYFRTIERDALASGGRWEDTWMPDSNITIKRIYLMRKDSAAFTASTFYFKVKDRVYTLPVAPAALFVPDCLSNPELNISVTAGEVIAWTLENREGTSISVMLSFECWE